MAYLLKTEQGEWVLDIDKCQGLFNDELMPINEFTYDAAMKWMENLSPELFDLEYYEDDCEVCPPKPRGKKKLVPYLEAHFYVFTKNKNVVMTSIDSEFETGSFETMQLKGLVDQSYILSVILCPTCGSYQLSLEQVDM